MARLRMLVVAQEADGDVYALAVCKFYAPGTASASGATTTGTPFASSIYAAISGGSPISTTQTLNSSGTLIVWTDSKSRFDVGIEPANGGTAFVRAYETMEFDPADVATMAAGVLTASGSGLLNVTSTTHGMLSPNGTYEATISNSGTFVAPGLLRMYGVYVATDHGVVTGADSTNAAANTAALNALWVTACNAGRPIYLGSGQFPFAAGINLDHATGFTLSGVGIYGNGHSTRLDMYGTTGPWLTFASGATSAIARAFFRDVTIFHAATPTSGATLQLGYVSRFLVEGVTGLASSSSLASLTSVKLIGSASALKFVDCKFETQFTGAVTPVSLDIVTTTGSTSGYEFHGTEFSGYQGYSTGIRWMNTTAIDTVSFSGLCLLKDHETGMRFGFGSNNGGVSNLTALGLHLDGITGIAVHMTPVGTATVENHKYVGSWFASTGDYMFVLDNTGPGTLRGITIDDSYLSGADTRSIYAVGAMSRIFVRNNEIVTSVVAGGAYGLEIGNGVDAVSDVIVTDNFISVGNSTAGAALIAANVTPVQFGGGTIRGVRPTVAGTLSSARVVTDYAFAVA